jgi:hypothetical protein
MLADRAQGGRHKSRITQVTELDGQDLQAGAPVTDRNIGWQVCSGGWRETSLFPGQGTQRLRKSSQGIAGVAG